MTPGKLTGPHSIESRWPGKQEPRLLGEGRASPHCHAGPAHPGRCPLPSRAAGGLLGWAATKGMLFRLEGTSSTIDCTLALSYKESARPCPNTHTWLWFGFALEDTGAVHLTVAISLHPAVWHRAVSHTWPCACLQHAKPQGHIQHQWWDSKAPFGEQGLHCDLFVGFALLSFFNLWVATVCDFVGDTLVNLVFDPGA